MITPAPIVQAPQGGKAVPKTIGMLIGLAALLSLNSCGGLGGHLGTPVIDFTMAASPGSQSVVAGQGAGYVVSVSPAAMIGQVSLSVGGLPPGTDAAFTPGFEVTGSRTLNVFTTTTTPPANSQLTITATGPGGSHSATVGLAITPAADFALSITPNSRTVKPGVSTTYSVGVNFTGSASGPVNLSVTGLPQGATAAFDKNPVTASGPVTLTITAGPDIITAIAPMNVVASDASGTIRAPFSFAIIPADFSLFDSVSPVEVNAGGTITGQISVDGLFATPGTVNLSVSALPAGVTATVTPNVITGGGLTTLNIFTTPTVTPGGYSLTVNGIDASGQNLVQIPFTVAPGTAAAGFFLSASPLSALINPGESAFFNIQESAPGTLPPLTFQVSGLPSGASFNVFPTGKRPGLFGLSISTSPFTSRGAASVTVTAIGPNGSESLNVILDVK